MDDKKLKYVPVQERTREEVEEIFRSGNAGEIGEALWSATYYDSDWRWVQSACLRYLEHEDLSLRRTAIICLGVLAVFCQQLDLDLVLPALHKAGTEPKLKPSVDDSLADIYRNIRMQ